jgi:hypothetical protein
VVIGRYGGWPTRHPHNLSVYLGGVEGLATRQREMEANNRHGDLSSTLYGASTLSPRVFADSCNLSQLPASRLNGHAETAIGPMLNADVRNRVVGQNVSLLYNVIDRHAFRGAAGLRGDVKERA